MSSGQPPYQPGQYNSASNGGSIYAANNGNITINNGPQPQRGLRIDTKALLIILPLDVVFFFYGMLAYTGRNTTGDSWRAGIFIFLLLTTLTMTGRWIRRRI